MYSAVEHLKDMDRESKVIRLCVNTGAFVDVAKLSKSLMPAIPMS